MSRLAPFSLRLTPEERSRLESQAGAMPLSSYIKSVVFAPEAPKYRRRRTPPVAEQQLLAVLPEVPRQRGAAAVARAGLQFGHRPALHRVARGHGRLVPHQPATETDQDRGACRPPRPRHHLPAGRGGRHRPDGPRHPRRDPPPSSATAMRMTEIKAQTERKRHDRSARRAEKHRRRAGMCGFTGPFTQLRAFARRQTPFGAEKTLDQVAQLGDCNARRQATWGMSATGNV